MSMDALGIIGFIFGLSKKSVFCYLSLLLKIRAMKAPNNFNCSCRCFGNRHFEI